MRCRPWSLNLPNSVLNDCFLQNLHFLSCHSDHATTQDEVLLASCGEDVADDQSCHLRNLLGENLVAGILPTYAHSQQHQWCGCFDVYISWLPDPVKCVYSKPCHQKRILHQQYFRWNLSCATWVHSFLDMMESVGFEVRFAC